MSKYLLFLILLLSFTVSAQQTAVQKSGLKKINQSAAILPRQSNWDEQESYVNGFARVLSNNKFSFINLAGKLICPLDLDGARNFSNHLVAVSKNNKWGFINESGAIVIPIGYDIVFDFTTTITGAFANKKWWLINNKGTVLQSIDVSTFYGFKNGIAKINKDGKWGTVNTKGEIVFDGTYTASANTNFSPFKAKNTPALNSAITICPDNIDFEFGSFFNWQCYIGHVDSIGTTNVITVAPSPPTVNRHTLYSRVLPSPLDPFGLFPINPPDGSNYALRLGNTKIGGEAERVRYTIHVPANDSNFSIKYDYAVVFQDPGHTIWTQPRFTVRVFDSAANSYVDCASFEYISTSNLPGFARSTVDTGVMYKPWSSVFLSLRGRAGKTMYLEFTTADCVRKGHWGYAYVDVEKPCGQSVEINYQCDTPHVTTLTGPVGFQFYNWWDSAFTTIIGTGQNVTLNPGPAIGTTFWLEMIPYNNFGCTDTLPVRITGRFNADFTMSDTTGMCAPHTFTFYNNHIPSTSAVWDFGDGTFGSGDTVTHTYNLPGNYIVKLNAILPSGCIGEGIKLVTIMQPTGSFSFDQTFYCNAQTARFDAVVTGTDSLFWNFGDGTTLHTLQTTVFHTYNVAGIYIPTLTVQSLGGCQSVLSSSDTIKVEILRPGFKISDIKTCGSTSVNFIDTSFSYFGITSRQWDFGDGNSGNGINVNHTYTTPGTYNVRLIITGTSGCVDTIIKPVLISVYDKPVASIIGDTARCQGSTVIFSSNVVTTDTVNYYRWTASNGYSGNAATFSTPFTTAGNYTIQLITGTTHGCYDTVVHQITINPTPNVSTPPDQVLCSGQTTTAINFTGTISGTTFTWTNTGPIIGLAASGSGNIPAFVASSNGAFTASAGITVKPTANGCPGPSKAFSITVHPIPTVAQPVNQLLCNGSNTNTVAFTGSVAGTTFNWVNSNPAIGLAATGSGNIISFTATNNTTSPITAIITVTPDASNCPGTSKTFTITVNPTPDVAQPADQQLCNGSMTAAINFSGAVSGTVYNWTNTNASIGLAASGSGNIASFAAVTSVSASSTATITVSPTANGCPGGDKTFTIAINPIATVLQPANQILCNGGTVSAISFSGIVPGTVYNWTNNNTAVGLPATGTGDISAFTAINKTSNSITATIAVIPQTTNCPGTAKTFTITIHPTPVVVASNSAIVCLGKPAQLSATGASQYTWSPADHLNCVNCSSPVSQPVDSIQYKVKGTSAFGCFAYDSVMLNVIKPFKMQVSPNDTLCIGESTDIYAKNANKYVWSPAKGLNRTDIANPNVKINTSSTYMVIGFDNKNCFTDTGYVTIAVGPKPYVNLGPDRTLSTGTPLTLNAVTQNGPIIKYDWTPASELSCNNCATPSTVVKNNSFYSVVVTNTFGCVATDTLFINSLCKSAQVFIPNAFTPDGDGLNDILMVRGRGITVKSFRIFNRWGELVFEKQNFFPDDPKFGWDGKVRGVPATPDVFVYTAEVYCDNGVVYTYKGNTTILK